MSEQHSTIQKTNKHKRTSLPVIFLTVFLDLVGFSIVFPLFPDMLDHYLEREKEGALLTKLIHLLNQFAHQASSADADLSVYVTVLFGGVLGAVYALLQFLSAPLWGKLSDRYGRRPILLITVAGLGFSYLLWIIAQSFFVLLLSRIIGGIMGGNVSVASAAAADISSEKNRAKAMGVIGAAFGLGFIFGPAIGAFLYHYSPPQLEHIFLLHPFSLPAIGACLLSILNLLWLSTRFIETYDHENHSQKTTRKLNPFRHLSRIEIPHVRSLTLIYFLFSLAFSGMEFTLTFLVKERFLYSPKDIALMFVFIGLTIAFVQGAVVRRASGKISEKNLGLFGFMCLAIGLFGLSFTMSEGTFYLFLGIMSFGSALLNPSLSSLVSLQSSKEQQGEVMGIFRSMGSLARAIAPIGACMMYWRYGSFSPYLIAGLMMIPPAIWLYSLSMRSSLSEQ